MRFGQSWNYVKFEDGLRNPKNQCLISITSVAWVEALSCNLPRRRVRFKTRHRFDHELVSACCWCAAQVWYSPSISGSMDVRGLDSADHASWCRLVRSFIVCVPVLDAYIYIISMYVFLVQRCLHTYMCTYECIPACLLYVRMFVTCIHVYIYIYTCRYA